MKLTTPINFLLFGGLVLGSAWFMADGTLLSKAKAHVNAWTGGSIADQVETSVAPAKPVSTRYNEFQWAAQPEKDLSLPNELFEKLNKAETAFDKKSAALLGVGKFEEDKPISVIHLPSFEKTNDQSKICLLYTSPSPRDATLSRMPSSA